MERIVNVINEKGERVVEWKIYFFYQNPERKKTFYFLYQESDPDSLVVMASADGKTLENVSEEEYQEAEEMLETYENDTKIQVVFLRFSYFYGSCLK